MALYPTRQADGSDRYIASSISPSNSRRRLRPDGSNSTRTKASTWPRRFLWRPCRGILRSPCSSFPSPLRYQVCIVDLHPVQAPTSAWPGQPPLPQAAMNPPRRRLRSSHRKHGPRASMRPPPGLRAPSGRLTRAASYATVIGTLLAAATLVITLGVNAHRPAELRPARLQPVSLVVQQTRDKPIVEVILHNLGGARSIVTEVQTHVLAEGQLTQCASQGELNLSGSYSVLLPATAWADQVIATHIHEQLAGDEADRFSLSFATVGETSVENSNCHSAFTCMS